MKSLMNFSDSALTRSEMINVKGGACYAEAAGPEKSFSTLAKARAFATKHGGRYCCDHCSTASWTGCGPQGCQQ